MSRISNIYYKLNVLVLITLIYFANTAVAVPSAWEAQFPKTDFSKTTINFEEIVSGGPPRDGIPSIDQPKFSSLAITKLDHQENWNSPVVSLYHNNEFKIYPLSILMWHEIVNDTIDGFPITVTYCPLCNTSIVFKRKFDNVILDFGTTGKLRHSDLIMYDRQTETWWQQFSGKGLIGKYAGQQLDIVASRLESLKSSLDRAKKLNIEPLILDTTLNRSYGKNPYAKYDSSSFPFLYKGDYNLNIAPMEYVVYFADHAITLNHLKENKEIIMDNYIINWSAGMSSALDTPIITLGRDIGQVIVQQKQDVNLIDIPYTLTFAFALNAFRPDIKIIF